MKIYKVSYFSDQEGNYGFSYHGSMREARRKARIECSLSNWPGKNDWTSKESWDRRFDIDVIYITPTKKGIIEALSDHGGHAKNG